MTLITISRYLCAWVRSTASFMFEKCIVSLATSTYRCYLLHAIAESYLNTSKIRIGEDVQNKIKFVSVKVILYQLVIKA